MFDCITLTVPAKESALMVVRLATAGVAARGDMDFETLEDVKTAVYEACYAMIVQKYLPENLTICFAQGEVFSVCIQGGGSWTQTQGRQPDLALCRAVLSTMIPHVDIDVEKDTIRCIKMHR